MALAPEPSKRLTKSVLSDLAFFSFVELTDQSQHRAYNEWHQLDHRPENLALPGVAWGDRWARRGDYVAASHAVGEFAAVDYVAMYWFRPPVDAALAAWDALGEASFQWGRGPIIPGVQRRMLAFFRPVKGYAAPRARVAAEVLPYRPHRGLHLTLTRFAEPHGLDTHEEFRREDADTIPALLELDASQGRGRSRSVTRSGTRRCRSRSRPPTRPEACASAWSTSKGIRCRCCPRSNGRMPPPHRSPASGCSRDR